MLSIGNLKSLVFISLVSACSSQDYSLVPVKDKRSSQSSDEQAKPSNSESESVPSNTNSDSSQNGTNNEIVNNTVEPSAPSFTNQDEERSGPLDISISQNQTPIIPIMDTNLPKDSFKAAESSTQDNSTSSSTPADPISPANPSKPEPGTGQARTVQKAVEQRETISIQPLARKIDLLFVVDNSSSMSNEQENLGRAFGNFIKNFKEKFLDFQIAVLSTDHTPQSESATHWTSLAFPKFSNEGPGTFLSYNNNQRILSNFSPNLEQQFKENVRLGSEGSGSEMGMASVIAAFEEAKIHGWNKNFIRNEALLSIIFVSDEDESTAYKNQIYLNSNFDLKQKRLSDFNQTLLRVKNNQNALVRVDSVIRPEFEPCQSGASVGRLYSELSKLWNGTIANICKDFSSDLNKMGDQISSQAQKRFALKFQPINTPALYFQGQLLKEGRDFTFNSESNYVELSDTLISLNAKKSSASTNFVTSGNLNFELVYTAIVNESL